MKPKQPSLSPSLQQKIRERICQKFSPEKIIVFGSWAYGTPHADSDVDLLVIMKSHKRPAARAVEISRVFYPRFLPMDIIVRTPREIKERLRIGDFFYQEILEKGLVLYDAKAA